MDEEGLGIGRGPLAERKALRVGLTPSMDRVA
jgi:hypothetical protein